MESTSKSRKRGQYSSGVPTAMILFLALGGTAGCERPPETRSDAPEPKTEFQESDVRVLGTSEAIAVVQDLEVLSDGSVWVLNSVEPFFVGFGPDGEMIRAYGKEGGGPEEFRTPRGLVSGGIDGEAWVLDVARHSLIRASHPESGWLENLIPRDSLPRGTLVQGRDFSDTRVRTARLGEEVLLARSTGSLREGVYSFWYSVWGGGLFAFDPDAGLVRKVLSLGEILGDPTPVLEQTDGFPPFPVWPRLWGVCWENEIRLYDRLRNEIRGFTAGGDELDPIALPPVSPTSVTHRQFARAVLGLAAAEVMGTLGRQVSPEDILRLLNRLVGEMKGEPEQLRWFLPMYVDIRCSEDGELWLRPFDVEVGGLTGGPNWLRIAPDGTLQEVRLPDRFDVFRVTSDRLWGVLRDDLDIASVAWIDVGEVR